MKPNRRLKKPDASSKLVLEEIIGLTTKNANGLASNISTASCAYVAGCVVAVYNVDSSTQSHLMVSHRTPKPLTCVAFSPDGRFVAAGETGNQPAVIVWDRSTLAFVSELKGHLYGVECIAFSSDGEHLVSVGGYIYLWDWRSGMLVTKLKASSSCSAITSVSFSSDAKFIITAGKKHLKLWTVGSSPKTRLNNGTGFLAMHGKPVDLGPQKGSSFISVTSAIWSSNSSVATEKVGDLFPVYALTDTGVLCLIDCGLSLRKSVELKVEKSFAMSASDKLIACACCNGIVQLFTSETLNYAGSLLYSNAKNFLGETNIVCPTGAIEKDFQPVTTLPDAIACQFSTSENLVVVYGDHTIVIWDIHDMNQATRRCVLVSHSACIWDVKSLCCENMHDSSLACVARGCSGGVSFATCSADGTIRLWDLELQPDLAEDDVDNHSLNTKPVGTTTAHLVSAGIFEQDTMEGGVITQGFRSMAASSDGRYLAAGDCAGNLHIYNLLNSDYTCFQDVHDAEILSLSFNLSSKKPVNSEVVDGNYYLVSGGRDRIINLYDVQRNFDLIESINDHSAAVTSVKLTCHGRKILSCSADRSLVFRDVSVTDIGHKILRRHHQIASHGTVYDMALDPEMEFVVTVGQDKKINTFDVASGKLTRLFKQDKDYGDPIKVTMDPSCSYLACSYSNRSMCIYDFISGEMVAQTMGHGEVITGVIFLPDCKHVISVGGDGCIFVWKLPACMSSRILQRMKGNSIPLSPKNLGLPLAFRQIMFSEEEEQQWKINPEDVLLLGNSDQVGEKMPYQGGGSQRTSTFRFSISRLPNWAKAKVGNFDSISMNSDITPSQPQQQLKLKSFPPMIGDGGECDHLCPEVQTPPSLDAGGSESCLSSLSRNSPNKNNSQRSTPQATPGCFHMDKRWHNVYTVCLDLLNSPEVQHLMDLKKPVSSSNLSQNPAEIRSDGQFDLEIEDGHKATLKRHAYSNNYGFLGKFDDQFSMHNTSKCHKAVAGHMAKQLHLHKLESQTQEVMEDDACHMKSENDDLFEQHFGSLSTTCKVQRSKSSVRRRYFAHYVVRQEYPGDSRRLFHTPVQDLGSKTLNCKGDVYVPINSENPAMQNLDEQQEINSCKQDTKNSSHADSQCESTKLSDATDKNECIPLGSNLQQRITACREALLNLDAAAENVLHLFSELGSQVSGEEISDGPGAKLYDDADELLPSIANRLNEVAKLVQRSNESTCKRSKVEVSGFEPFLGTFAESLSQRVVDILKKNLSKD